MDGKMDGKMDEKPFYCIAIAINLTWQFFNAWALIMILMLKTQLEIFDIKF